MVTAIRLYLTLLLTTVSLLAAAQVTMVTGVIKDNRDVAVTGATVCQVNTANCTTSDRNGLFHLALEQGKGNSLMVECLGFNPVEVVTDESTVYPLTINITPMYIPYEAFFDDEYDHYASATIMRSSLTMDAFFTDFTEFTLYIGPYNTDLMTFFSVVGPELGASFSRVYFGIGIGMGYGNKDDNDTLAIDINNAAYKLSLGYDLISSRRIRLTPTISARWLRWRLQNYPGERKIPLTTYLSERDIDLRFNQAVAVAGLNLEYLMYSGTAGKGDYWSVGLSGGYAIKINQTPWVYSRGNRLTTDRQINLDPWTISLSISYYTVAK
jgi:hypothetical protein